MVYIYALIPSDGKIKEIGYIGISDDLDRRLTQHRSSDEDTAKGQWIRSLRSSGRTVDMIVLDRAEDRMEAHIKENAWILFANHSGWPITNSTAPGQHRDLFAPGFNAAAAIEKTANQYQAEVDRIQYEANISILNAKLDAERQARLEAKRRFDFAISALAKLYVLLLAYMTWSMFWNSANWITGLIFAVLMGSLVYTGDFVFKGIAGNVPIYRLNIPEVLTPKSVCLMFYDWWRGMSSTEKLMTAQVAKMIFIYPWLLPLSYK